jgi:hypothetical protein
MKGAMIAAAAGLWLAFHLSGIGVLYKSTDDGKHLDCYYLAANGEAITAYFWSERGACPRTIRL